MFLFLSGEFLLHIPCWLLFYVFIFIWGVSLTHPAMAFFLLWGVSLTQPMLASFIKNQFLWGISLAHPVLASFLCGKFVLHIPCWLHFYLGEFLLHIPHWLYFPVGVGVGWGGGSVTHTGFIFMWGVFFFFFTSRAVFIFMWGVSLTHPVISLSLFLSLTHSTLALFFCGEFLLHILNWLHLYVGSFSYTSHVGFFFFFFFEIWGVSLTHPLLAFIFIWEVSLTHAALALFFCVCVCVCVCVCGKFL